MDRLNLLFQKDRIEWEYYNKEYGKLEDELSKISSIPDTSKKDYGYIENILDQDFTEIYSKLTPENKRSFWQSIIKQIYIGEDHQIKSVDFL